MTLKTVNISLALGLIIAILLSFARFDAACSDVRSNVFRLHIKAASDSKEDQELKLLIRDAILEEKGENFGTCSSLSSAINYANENIDEFESIAKKVINEQGFNYDVKVSVGNAHFDNRVYDEFTLPAGEYQALNIIIGQGKGQNWWCVMFPALCIGAAKDLSLQVGEEGCEITSNSEKYEIKFKTVEIYEKLRKIFIKN